jgi:hypothetical protein
MMVRVFKHECPYGVFFGMYPLSDTKCYRTEPLSYRRCNLLTEVLG